MNYNIALLYEDININNDEVFINSRFKMLIDTMITIKGNHCTKENEIAIFGNQYIDNIKSLSISDIDENFSKFNIILVYGYTEKFIKDISNFLENFIYIAKIIFIPNIKLYNQNFSFIPYIKNFHKIFLGSEYEYSYFINYYLENETYYKNRIYLTKFPNYIINLKLSDSANAIDYIKMKEEFNIVAFLAGTGKNLSDIFKICELSKQKNLKFYYKIIINKQLLNINIELDEYFGNPDHSLIEFIDSSDLKSFEKTLESSFLTIIPFKDEYYRFELSEVYHAFQLTNRILVNPQYALEEFYNLNKSLEFINFKYSEESFNDKNRIIEETLSILSIYNQTRIYEKGIADLGYCKGIISPKTIAYQWFEYFNFINENKKNVNCINAEADYNKHFNRRIFNYDKWSIIEDDIALQRF